MHLNENIITSFTPSLFYHLPLPSPLPPTLSMLSSYSQTESLFFLGYYLYIHVYTNIRIQTSKCIFVVDVYMLSGLTNLCMGNHLGGSYLGDANSLS